MIDGHSLASYAAKEIGIIVLIFLAIGALLGFAGAALFFLVF